MGFVRLREPTAAASREMPPLEDAMAFDCNQTFPEDGNSLLDQAAFDGHETLGANFDEGIPFSAQFNDQAGWDDIWLTALDGLAPSPRFTNHGGQESLISDESPVTQGLEALTPQTDASSWEATPESPKNTVHKRQKLLSGCDVYIGMQQKMKPLSPFILRSLGKSMIFIPGPKVGEILRKHSPSSNNTMHKLVEYLQTWECEPKFMHQLTKHDYKPSILPEYEDALCFVEGNSSTFLRHVIRC